MKIIGIIGLLFLMCLINNTTGQNISASVSVGLVVKFPDNTTTANCVKVPENASGKELLNTAGINFNGSDDTDWGFLLKCINNTCSPADWSWYWSFYIHKKNETLWNYMPVGMGPGGSKNNFCWNRNYSDGNGTYCAKEGDVLGFGNGFNDSPNFYTFDEVCNTTLDTTPNTTLEIKIIVFDYFGEVPDADVYLNNTKIGETDENGSLIYITPKTYGVYKLGGDKFNRKTERDLNISDNTANITEPINLTVAPDEASLKGLGWIAENQNRTSGQLKGNWIWDDCFGLWAFNYFLYSKHENLYNNLSILLNYVKSRQLNNAGWGFGEDVDSTGVCLYGALINGLSIEQLTKNNKTPIEIITGQQGNNGGFVSFGTENVQTTAWGIIGLAGIGEKLPLKNNKTPIDYLRKNQNSDGSWEYMDDVYDTSAVLIALKLANISPDDGMVENAINFLITKQRNDGSFSDNDFYNSLITLGLKLWNKNNRDFDMAVNKSMRYLIWKQHSDGGLAKDNLSEPQSTVTALASLALAKTELEKLEGIKVSLVIKFPDNTTITKCVNVIEKANGKEILNVAGMQINGSDSADWGFMLNCIDNSCSPSDWSWYWGFEMHKINETDWISMPVGTGPGGTNNNFCWDKDYNNHNGHYCADDGDVILLNATTGKTVENYAFYGICKKGDNENCSENSECISSNCLCGVCRLSDWECYSGCGCPSGKYCSSNKCYYPRSGGGYSGGGTTTGGGFFTPVSTPTVKPSVVCGDGECETNETKDNCQKDCIICGDETCDKTENYENCPSDCKKPVVFVCGDGKCDVNETKENCQKDCSICGDETCDKTENYENCPSDCEKENKKLDVVLSLTQAFEGEEFTVFVSSEGKPVEGINVKYNNVTKKTDKDGKVEFNAFKGASEVGVFGGGYEQASKHVAVSEKITPPRQEFPWVWALAALILLLIALFMLLAKRTKKKETEE